jgi:hypothetical protein
MHIYVAFTFAPFLSKSFATRGFTVVYNQLFGAAVEGDGHPLWGWRHFPARAEMHQHLIDNTIG